MMVCVPIVFGHMQVILLMVEFFPGGVEILKACPVADQFRHLFAVIVLGERLTLLAKVGLIKAPQINCHEDKSGAQGIRSRQSIR